MKDPTQPDSIVTLTEFAALLDPPVSRQAAHGMADRDDTFPRPLCYVSGGKTALFWRKDALRYRDERKARAAAAAEPAPA